MSEPSRRDRVQRQRARLAAEASEHLAACRAALAADGLLERPQRRQQEGHLDPLRELLAAAKAAGRPCWAEASRRLAAAGERWGRLALTLETLVRTEARRRAGRYSVMGAADLEQAGREGLLYGATKWKPELGSFHTYGRLWVRAYMNRALNQEGEDVVIPAGHQEHRLRLAGVLADLAQQGRGKDLRQAAKLTGMPLSRVEELAASLGYLERFDAPASGGGLEDGPTLADRYVDAAAEPPDEVMAREHAIERMRTWGLMREVMRTWPQDACRRGLNELVAEFGIGKPKRSLPRRTRAAEQQMALPLLRSER